MSIAEPLPPSLSELLAERSKACARYPIDFPHQWRTSRATPSLLSRLLGRSPPDTPLASFYRIYEFFVLEWTTAIRNELEYFCGTHPDWSISALPDPADPDPVRYATLAVLTRLMCDAFNRRIELGLPRNAPAIILDFEELQARPKVYERPPAWAERVPPLAERVFIRDAQGNAPVEGESDISEEFETMNIIVRMPHIHFI
ncbi:uncharacterized protein LAESUDRAFT_536937 [Laetiporus sulphureus 93-53]|uniref:Uncharacterized protein n=1 Tax=Laetiporus sulphureus 93-53 TaxID=1314785 RepID=A0A165B9A5_9APHY|nr:uncharacterized protein LAESUDRAFT_536937 [Laetiporus sulphureus 93-53]KZT00542.1 hypothetical protein LAESUDRAFT_536937 [Laetiporus sulphureus 93-53]